MSDSAPSDANINALAARVLMALRSWHTDQRHASELSDLFRYQQCLRRGDSAGRAAEFLLRTALQELGSYAPQQAELLRLRFEKGRPMTQVGHRSDWSQSALYSQQRAAIRELAKVLLQQDAEEIASRLQKVAQEIPVLSTMPLVGIESRLKDVAPPLQSQDAPWMVGIWGMGGLGKTTLADAIARHLLLQGYVERVIWVSAKQEMLSGGGHRRAIPGATHLDLSTLKDLLVLQVLQVNRAEWQVPDFEQMAKLFAALKKQAHLVVLDNLETAPNVAELLPFLRKISVPTKILLTSRARLQDEDDIFEYKLPPLTEPEAHRLLVQEGELRHIESLQGLDPAVSRRIYEVVGGNPLAIRLVAGQLRLYPIESVLDDLKQTTGVGETLYHFLFEWVWGSLDAACRQVLIAMILAPEDGINLSALARLAQMEITNLKNALMPLISQNLIEIRTETKEPTYSIHNLTRTFLHELTSKG